MIPNDIAIKEEADSGEIKIMSELSNYYKKLLKQCVRTAYNDIDVKQEKNLIELIEKLEVSEK